MLPNEYVILMNTLRQYAEFYLRGYFRKKIPSNLILKGAIDFAKTAELISDTKILLNVMPWFKDGIHDRVLTAMHNGSICLTDSSAFCQGIFQHEKNIVFFDLNKLDRLPEQVKLLQSNTKKAKEIAQNGKKIAQTFTWDLFVEKYILCWL